MKITVSIMIIMVPVLTFGLLNMTGPMGISLIAGFTCAVLINLDRFDSFKAGQLEAQIKSATKTIKEVNATISQLKEVTEPLMNYILAHIVRGDSYIGLPAQDKEKLYRRIKINSEQFRLNDEYHTQLLNEAKYKVIETYLFEIEVMVEQKHKWEDAKPVREYIDINYDKRKLKFPSGAEIRELFTNFPNLHSDQVEQAILKYERSLKEYNIDK